MPNLTDLQQWEVSGVKSTVYVRLAKNWNSVTDKGCNTLFALEVNAIK